MLTDIIVNRLASKDRIVCGRDVSVIGMLCNLVLVAAKGIAGIASGSISMVADAVNNLMDAASNVISLVGFKLAAKPADAGHPYGHGRFEYLAGLAVAVLVIVAGVELGRESVSRLMHASSTNYGLPALVALVASVALKLWLARLYRKTAERIDSTALHAASEDSRNDALSTSAVLIGALVTRFAGINLDGWLGLGVAAFVVVSGVKLLHDTVNPLLGSTPDDELVERVRQRILSYPGVLDTHDLMIHDYGPGHRFASAHVEMAAEANPLETHAVIDAIERDLRAAEGLATILHYDPIVTRDPSHTSPRNQISEAVRAVSERLSVHDVRTLVNADKSMTFAFDCVVPPDVDCEIEQLEKAIAGEVSKTYPNATCSITFDTGYVSPSA